MPDQQSLQNYFRLLHNLDFKTQQQDTGELIKLLSQSDVAMGDINFFKNEDDATVAANLQKNVSLKNELNNPAADDNKKFRVFRRETPFMSARVAGSVPAWARGAMPAFTLGPFTSFSVSAGFSL